MDHYDQREQRRHPGLDEQRDVLDDHRVVSGRSDQFGPPAGDKGWTIPFSARRLPSSLKAMAASAGRSSAPSGRRMCDPNSSTSAASPSVPDRNDLA